VVVAEPDDQGRAPAGAVAGLPGNAIGQFEAPAEADVSDLRPERFAGEFGGQQG